MPDRHTDWGGYKGGLDLNEKLMVAIVKASEAYKKDADSIFRNYGLTFSKYNVLRILGNSPGGKNTITISNPKSFWSFKVFMLFPSLYDILK